MKGKATLTLIDAESGEVIKTVTEENMFTDAMANILNPAPYTMMHSFSYSALMRLATPLWEHFLGGVMLLSTPLTESADNIFLPAGAQPLATAGGGYSGDDTWRGTLNANESYPLENGYHFTWDFATDKANGTVACIALTSKPFANCGFNSTSSNANGGKLVLNHQSSTDNPNAGYFVKAYGQYVGTFEHNVHLFVYEEWDGTLTFNKVRGVDPEALMLLDECGCSEVTEPFVSVNISVPISIYDACGLYAENGMVYYFKTTDDKVNGTTQVEYVGIDALTLEMTEHVTFTTEYKGTSQQLGAVHGDYVWFSTNDCVVKCSKSGEVLSEFALNSTGGVRFFTVGGRLMIHLNGEMYDLEGDQPMMMYSQQTLIPADNVDIKAPYAALTSRGGHAALGPAYTNLPVVGIMGNYLATINNLSVPITKTSEQVLKVSYDITNP